MIIDSGGSKSISNRLLIINALYGDILDLKNISKAKDTVVLNNILKENKEPINVGHAGTAMRFLTAYFAILENKKTLITGSERMKQRPIGILVDALNALGAEINYIEKEGFPPLEIIGKKIRKESIALSANVSSQYISALMLVGSKFPNGLVIRLKENIVSTPYLILTKNIQNSLGIPTSFDNDKIVVPFIEKIKTQMFYIENDWSSASYFYLIMALKKNGTIKLKNLFQNSSQADSVVVSIFEKYFGVETQFLKNAIILKPISNFSLPTQINIDCTEFPDLAQTLAVTALGLKIPIKLTGLQTLKIKETDRILALKNEMEKFGGLIIINDSSLEINNFVPPRSNILVKTYQDHRMAMSFAPLKIVYNFDIENKAVVEKSYPHFWEDFTSVLQNK